jgi:hypothetical protein
MATKLDKTLKREIEIKGELYIVTISPEGVKVTGKGKRNGPSVAWTDFVGGDPAAALSASLAQQG